MSRSRWLPALVLLAGCTSADRPIHPYRLEGFPGAPIEPDLFPLRSGVRWVFRDRIDPELPPLELKVEEREGGLVLLGIEDPAGDGTGPQAASIAFEDGFLDIRFGRFSYRPLKLAGKVGDRWRTKGPFLRKGTRYIVFGYDEIEVLGERRRALVVAAERLPLRDVFWFVKGYGWVRLRTELQGRAKRDAVLVEFDPGGAN